MKKNFLSVVFLSVISFLLFIIILFFYHSKNQNQVCFKEHCFIVELATSAQEKAQGLMFRKNLDSDKGMLFVFENEGEHPFWMKNTLILLDIIWLNKDKEVVFISKNTKLCAADFCPIINPNKKAQYILELNAGMADKIGLNVGDKFFFAKNF